MSNGEASAHVIRPKLLTILREGYSLGMFRHDLIASVTVAIVALPLSMAIAVASGVGPERGLYTAIIGGFVVSALSGSRYQIGGPAGAFITLMATTLSQIGLEGFFTAVLLSGVFLMILGLARAGSLVRHIPHPVTVGFTCGIAVTILASQLKDLSGLKLAGPEPGAFFPKLVALAHAAATLNLFALALGIGTAAIIFAVRRMRSTYPSMLIAVASITLLATWLRLPVDTIASRFGSIPSGLPIPSLPSLAPDVLMRALPAALSFTLLGSVESLLSAKVADSMTGRQHRSNMELVGQGIANIASACFGGVCVTGTIARTATNIRAGAKSPVAGMLHAAILLVFMIVAAPLAGYIPLAALAGVLVTVCWHMAEKEEFVRLVRIWPNALVLVTTFGLTLSNDLTTGIIGGCAIAAALFWLGRRRTDKA